MDKYNYLNERNETPYQAESKKERNVKRELQGKTIATEQADGSAIERGARRPGYPRQVGRRHQKGRIASSIFKRQFGPIFAGQKPRKPEEFEYVLVKNCQAEQAKITASNAQRYWAWPMLAPFGLTARHAR